jgi:hypothetical protein
MNNEQDPREEKIGPAPANLPDSDRSPNELEPVLITPAGRFWEIPLPPETEAALRTSRF